VLNGHPLVATAVTLIVTFSSGDKQIESWAVPKAPDTITGKELRDHIAERLPHFNVPWRVNIIDAMPLTTSGKIDRSKLLAGRGLPEPSKMKIPQNALDRMISVIWGEILGVTGIARDSSFFELGGDSLSAMRLLHRIEEQLGIRMPLSGFFDASTLESFTELLLNHSGDISTQLHENMNSREEFEL
jgi:acyl carrier protein